MRAIPSLSDAAIRARVGNQSFQRGLGYFRNQAIFAARRQGQTLKARCQGSADEPYRLEVTFDGSTIAWAHCSCPVGHGGFCKHVAVLLLAWRAHPEDFVEVEELAVTLERRTKAELIGLIQQMLRRDPDLEALLELPLPRASKTRSPANPTAFRRQAAAAFQRADPNQWGIEGTIADELLALKEIGDGFATAGEVSSAVAVYEAVAGEVIENYATFPNDNGELSGVVDASVAALTSLLERTPDDAARLTILRTLFALCRANLANAPDFALTDEARATLVERTTPSERQAIASWVRAILTEEAAALDGADSDAELTDGDPWHDLLFDLEKDTLDDEAYLRACRAAGRFVELVDRLLGLGRVNEAAETFRLSPPHFLVTLAQRLAEAGQDDLAERLVEERLASGDEPTLLSWQKERYVARGDRTRALAVARKLFRSHPSLISYEEIRDLAQPLGRWPTIQAELRAELKRLNRGHLLVETYLADGEIDLALAAVRSDSTRGATGEAGVGYDSDLSLRVAQAAETSRPAEALEIYRRRAERLIEGRNRSSYRAACQLLAKVRTLSEWLGSPDAWSRYLADLRQAHRTLRAFQEELSAAGL